MINENYGADGAAGVFRLSLTALAMILAGIALWTWDDGQTASTKPPIILAGQTR
jgi:hypothetical protein